jgi:hypothetical protein
LEISTPEYFYKYRPIQNNNELESDYVIDALFKNQAIFSNRKNFNDIFDSKINFIKPTPRQIKQLKNQLPKNKKALFSDFIANGKFTPEGDFFLSDLKKRFEKVIDGYVFYCVSEDPVSNLMWSHYASSHSGFCIQFKSSLLKAKKVTYQCDIPSISILDLIKIENQIIDNKVIGYDVWTALRTKLKEWSYEKEYRFQADNLMKVQALETKEKFTIIQYTSDFVEAIIFGCRMEQNVKDYIINNMPNKIKYKEAIIRSSSLKIIDYKYI